MPPDASSVQFAFGCALVSHQHKAAEIDRHGLIPGDQVKGDTHLLMRGPECNLITEKDCRLPLPHLNIDDNTAKARQRNWDRLKSDIISQVRRCQHAPPPSPQETHAHNFTQSERLPSLADMRMRYPRSTMASLHDSEENIHSCS